MSSRDRRGRVDSRKRRDFSRPLYKQKSDIEPRAVVNVRQKAADKMRGERAAGWRQAP